MAQEGVLGRTSCRSWVPWACWGGPRAVESRTNPPAGWLAGCRGLPGGVLGVTGSWEGAAALDGISAILDCGWDADGQAASVCVAASRQYCRPAWRPRPRGTTEDHLNVERGQGKTVCAAGRGREGVRNMPRGWQWSCPVPSSTGGGSGPTAIGHPVHGCRGTGAARQPCRPSEASLGS